MKIKIVTTEKKLTKAIISQMSPASRAVMKCGKVLGYANNADKYHWKTIIIEFMGNYFTIPAGFKNYGTYVSKRAGKGMNNIRFDSEEICNEWWELYTKVLKKATTQIYI